MSKIKNIIFDLDGTLWDSRKQIIESWKTIIPNLNLSTNQLNELMGKTTEDFIKLLFPNSNIEKANIIMKELEQAEVDYLTKNGANLYDNIIKILKTLTKKYNLYIVSNCQKGYIESFLTYYNIKNLFHDIECNGNTNKPKNENIQLIITRNNLTYEETCYIGDTETDYQSASDNNILFIWAKYGFGNNLNCDHYINNPSEIIKTIEKIK